MMFTDIPVPGYGPLVVLNYEGGGFVYMILCIEGPDAGRHFLFARLFLDWKRDPEAEVGKIAVNR